MTKYLFVYGTLKGNRLGFATTFVKNAEIKGNLYDLGPFPAVILGGEGTVKGELHRVEDDRVWQGLDRYEGVPDLYRREVTTTMCGEDTYVYEYQNAVTADQLVEKGEWNVVRQV